MRSFLAPFTVTICPWRDWVQKEKAREEISLQAQSVKKVEVQEALLPLNRRGDYCRSPRSFRVTPAGR